MLGAPEKHSGLHGFALLNFDLGERAERLNLDDKILSVWRWKIQCIEGYLTQVLVVLDLLHP